MFERSSPRAAMKCLVVLLWVIVIAVTESPAQSVCTRIIPSDSIQLRDARGLSVSPEGYLYIADTGHHRIIVSDSVGRVVAETGGFGNSHGQFQWPRSVAAGQGNVVWVLDYGNRRIEKFTRSLEYQGSFTITVPAEDLAHQPDGMAFSPSGDSYIFDRDGGRLLHFDPLFRQIGDLGGRSGSEFISSVASIAFVPRSGLYWWTRGSRHITHTDGLLNSASGLPLSEVPKNLILAAMDSCLLFGSESGIREFCPAATRPDTVLPAAMLKQAGITTVTALAAGMDRTLYLLDGPANSVYRIKLGE
jgi:hypothetical protein